MISESILKRCEIIAKKRNLSKEEFSTQWKDILQEAINQEEQLVLNCLMNDHETRKKIINISMENVYLKLNGV